MPSNSIIAMITSQIPLLIMTINNGISIQTLLPILLVPFIIYIIEIAPGMIKNWKREKVPSDYVYYYVGDNSKDRSQTGINFIQDISIFINKFCPSTIKIGTVKNYRLQKFDRNALFRCYQAIISLDDNYHCKFSFTNKMDNGKNILENIKKTGFILPDDIDLKNLLENPIYLTLVEFKEPNDNNNNQRDKKQSEITKQYIKISTCNIKAAEDFVYIVVNYNIHTQNNIIDFRLKKTIYYHDIKHDYNDIISTVNVNKNYKNVFLSKKNYKLVHDTIIEWNENKIAHLDNGIPNKLGFFLIGSPGCGKSSLVYAIATETKKHIVSVNLQDLTNQSFMSLMSTIDNKIVVFDDIDTHKFTHIRDNKIDNHPEKNLELALMSVACNNNKGDDYKSSFFKEMTLDVLLEVLDGYNYLNNCIVILTSNHPELLDSAVTRPGRVDHVIEFKLCDEFQFRRIFKYFVGINYKEIKPSFIFKEHTYSTSFLINTIILPNIKCPNKIIKLLEQV